MNKFSIVGAACLWVGVSGCGDQGDDETGSAEQNAFDERTQVDLINARLFELENRVAELEAAARPTEAVSSGDTSQPSDAASSAPRSPSTGSKLIRLDSQDQ